LESYGNQDSTGNGEGGYQSADFNGSEADDLDEISNLTALPSEESDDQDYPGHRISQRESLCDSDY
jgi:hypothetical protein